MGKRILQRHRGKGGLQYRAPKKGKFAVVRYPFVPAGQTADAMILDIVHERGRTYPLAKIDVSEKRYYIPAVAGMVVAQLSGLVRTQLSPRETFCHSPVFQKERRFAILNDTWEMEALWSGTPEAQPSSSQILLRAPQFVFRLEGPQYFLRIVGLLSV